MDAKPQLDDLAKSYLTTTPDREKDKFPLDLSYWAEHQEEIANKYTAWLAG